jgi:hypothetical protein
MKRLLIAAVAVLALAVPAHAGTQLQLQFQRWGYEGNGAVKLLATLRNPTMKPFARVVWGCDLLDKENRLVGQGTLVFNVVPWGAVVVQSQYVYSNGMFEDGECKLLQAEEVTPRNERFYSRNPYTQPAYGLALPEADHWFNLDYRIQGRQQVITKEEDDKLKQMHEAGQLVGRPGYSSTKPQKLLRTEAMKSNPQIQGFITFSSSGIAACGNLEEVKMIVDPAYSHKTLNKEDCKWIAKADPLKESPEWAVLKTENVVSPRGNKAFCVAPISEPTNCRWVIPASSQVEAYNKPE